MIPNPIMSTNRNLQQVVTIHSRNSWNSMICCWIWDYHSLHQTHQTSCPKVWESPVVSWFVNPVNLLAFLEVSHPSELGSRSFRVVETMFFFFFSDANHASTAISGSHMKGLIDYVRDVRGYAPKKKLLQLTP